MKRLILIASALAFVTAQPFAQTRQATQTQSSAVNTAPIRTMLDTYCVACHSDGLVADANRAHQVRGDTRARSNQRPASLIVVRV